jgi:hypothetical protein
LQSRVDSWKRPADLFEKGPIVVDPDVGLDNFDLLTPNEHLHHCEVIIYQNKIHHKIYESKNVYLRPCAGLSVKYIRYGIYVNVIINK